MRSRPSVFPKLDLTSVVGVPLGVGLIAAGQVLEGGTVESLFQVTAAVIVFGGTLGAVLFSFSPVDVRHAMRRFRTVFIDPPNSEEETIQRMVRFAIKARREGIMALDEELDRIDDPFLRKGMMLAVDGVTPHTVSDMMGIDNQRFADLDETAASVYEAAGGYAPTIGILGAVIGLIHVMQKLTEPSELGAGIAVAFVATLYGVGSANLIFLPIATKIRRRAQQAAKHRELVLAGLAAIQEGLSPRLIELTLRGFTGAEPSTTPRPQPTVLRRSRVAAAFGVAQPRASDG